MAGKKGRAEPGSIKAQHNASLEDLRNKVSRTNYSIVAFHIVNTGLKLTDADMKILKTASNKAMHQGVKFIEQYRR